jgi:membrane-bound lytic murein transglycosylase D
MERFILNFLPRTVGLLILIGMLSGCTTLSPQSRATTQSFDHSEALAPDPEPLAVDITPEPPADLWDRIRRELEWSYPDHPSVIAQREHYLKQAGLFDALSERANWYLYYIVEQVEARELPIELALLPIVESTLLPQSMSHRSAAGLWQIMPRTGKHLGLQQNWWYDGRLDIRDSTRAALDYLESLHSRFDGDWLLALSAYNAGETRVKRAQRANSKRGLPTDYWSLKLPRETQHYLPRLLALAQIIKDPQTHAVTLPSVANTNAFAAINVTGQVEIRTFAEQLGVDEYVLRRFNPGILRWATDPNGSSQILVPSDIAGTAMTVAESLPSLPKTQWHRYTIQPGDSLIRIAKRFDLEVSLLRAANDITGSFIRAGHTLMIPTGGDSAIVADGSRVYRASMRYTVKPGDSLYKIADRFSITISDLVAWNAIDPKAYLRPGQRLTLFPSES